MRFRLDRKTVVKVRYYETMYFITDSNHERVFTGSDKVTAEKILKALNREHLTRPARARAATKKKSRPAKKAKRK